MKKYLLIISLAFSSILSAQSPIEVGQMQFNGGFGFSNYGLPVYAGLDFGFREDISLGGEISFRSYNDKVVGGSYKTSLIGFAANTNYHFNTLLDIPSEYDVYAGLNIGFYVWNSNFDYPGKKTSGLGLGLQIGGRYYFTDNWAANLQLGGGNATSGGKIGISYRF
jgi:opacity protein-like surface antigen